MPISIFEMFRVGIGPSSSHTVGPMRAATLFVKEAADEGVLSKTEHLTADLMGSLGATGKGHATDSAVMLGLMGLSPETVDTSAVAEMMASVRDSRHLPLAGGHTIVFDPAVDITFSPDKAAAFHTNGLQIAGFDASGKKIIERRYYSVGGGFVVPADNTDFDKPRTQSRDAFPDRAEVTVPFNYTNASELVAMARASGKTIAEVVRDNERTRRSDAEIDAALDHVWNVMRECIQRGLKTEGVLPGPLRVKRRAPQLLARLKASEGNDPLAAIDWVNAWGFATGEENAAGGRIVTCPTNGAAGVLPAVLQYYVKFVPGADQTGVRNFLLTAGAVGMLYKENASISGAEVGCQGEVGVATSMAAAGLAAAKGATLDQVENAAEIGMEHQLGLTCDPVAGQVQIPCIERNAVGAVKAIEAVRISMAGDGRHVVSLDKVMRTMFETGRDMKAKYKETSRGGLAVTIVEC